VVTTGAMAAVDQPTDMANSAGAVGVINADFFNIGETGAAVGPAVVGGEHLKAAVPGKQRYGPSRPGGPDNGTVFGVTDEGKGEISSLALDGKAVTDAGSFALDGLNQYAITVDGVGIFTSDWGEADRQRAVCGTDDDRDGPCSESVREVTVTDGKVSAVSDSPGSGAIADNEVVLLARDAGVSDLEGLAEGDAVEVDYQLASNDGATMAAAAGAIVLVDEGAPVGELEDSELAPRTAAGYSEDGNTLYLAVVDGRSGSSVGATYKTLVDIMTGFGAQDVVNFDGGGSSVLGAADSSGNVVVRNDPSDGSERAVPNGIAVFSEG
ncbi:MAG: phosphodiester glycosidase family protein, partial [Stackebrandtia sp.]